jgi:hypothetical protein
MKKKAQTKKARRLPILHLPRCCNCGKEGPVIEQIDDLPDPPQWVLENAWLLRYAPLCRECLHQGARTQLCHEGGDAHAYHGSLGATDAVCLDCGESVDSGPAPTIDEMLLLQLVRRGVAIKLRETEVELLEMFLRFLSGPSRRATEARLHRLKADLQWLKSRKSHDEEFTNEIGNEVKRRKMLEMIQNLEAPTSNGTGASLHDAGLRIAKIEF